MTVQLTEVLFQQILGIDEKASSDWGRSVQSSPQFAFCVSEPIIKAIETINTDILHSIDKQLDDMKGQQLIHWLLKLQKNIGLPFEWHFVK